MPNPLPPETTPEWTAADEFELQWYGRAQTEGYGATTAAKFAHKIIRLRSEREAQDAEIAKLGRQHFAALSKLDDENSRLRSELSRSRSADVAEIRRQRNAWRDYADHLDHCVECSQMGPIGDCFERKELQEATKCLRCGGSARALPDVECHICAEPRR